MISGPPMAAAETLSHSEASEALVVYEAHYRASACEWHALKNGMYLIADKHLFLDQLISQRQHGSPTHC